MELLPPGIIIINYTNRPNVTRSMANNARYIYIYRQRLTFQSPVVAPMLHVLQETTHFSRSVFTSVLCMIRRVNKH